MEEFRQPYYQTINLTRLRVLQDLMPQLCKSLGLKTCIELGCGGNVFTPFLTNDLHLETTVVDGRQNLVDLYSDPDVVNCNIKEAIVWNLNLPWEQTKQYDVVFAYGIIYHLSNQAQFVLTAKKLCSENGIILIDAMVNTIDRSDVKYVTEEIHPTQAIDGRGTRSSISYLHNLFHAHFPYLYVHAKPDHEEYQTNKRTQFIASKKLISSTCLSRIGIF